MRCWSAEAWKSISGDWRPGESPQSLLTLGAPLWWLVRADKRRAGRLRGDRPSEAIFRLPVDSSRIGLTMRTGTDERPLAGRERWDPMTKREVLSPAGTTESGNNPGSVV